MVFWVFWRKTAVLRRSRLFLTGLSLAAGALVLTLGHARMREQAAAPERALRAQLVARLELTDLALFTEARYTRHPSQADLHSAFQDYPLALEHFPSGSLVPVEASRAVRP